MKKLLPLLLALCILLGSFSAASAEFVNEEWQNVTYATGNINAVTTDVEGITSSKDTLVIAMNSDPGSFDVTYSINYSFLAPLMFNHLLVYRYDENGAIGAFVDEQSLATGYEVDEDGLGITFYLREGVKFSNGYDFTAEDAAFSLWHARSQSDLAMMDADNITVVDDYTLHVGLLRQDANAVYCIGGIANMYSKQYYDECGGEENDAEFCSTLAVGTGPYKLVEWVSGDHVLFERNDDYFAGRPVLDYVNVRVISDPSVAFMALQNGEIDIIPDILTNWIDVSTVVNGMTTGITDYVEFNTTIAQLGFNCYETSPLKDIAVRKAICYAIDRESIAEYVYEGAGRYITSLYAPASEGAKIYDPWPYEYNPEMARQILADAGYEDGDIQLRIIVGTGDTLRTTAAELMIANLAEVGIELSIINIEVAAVASTITDDPSAWEIRYNNMSNGNFLQPNAISFFGTGGTGQIYDHIDGQEGAEYSMQLADQINATADPEERAALYEEFQDYYIENCMFTLPLVQVVQHTLVNSSLRNFSRTHYLNLDVAFAYFE